MAKHRKTGIELSALPPKADIRIAAKKHRYSITVWRDGFVIALLMPYTDVEAQPNTDPRTACSPRCL